MWISPRALRDSHLKYYIGDPGTGNLTCRFVLLPNPCTRKASRKILLGDNGMSSQFIVKRRSKHQHSYIAFWLFINNLRHSYILCWFDISSVILYCLQNKTTNRRLSYVEVNRLSLTISRGYIDNIYCKMDLR